MFGLGATQIINESIVDVDKVVNAIKGRKRIVISYSSEGKNEALGPRMIEIYAYGETTSGNPVIRAFEPYGDTLKSGVPQWKMFRLDRIRYWYDTGQTFDRPADEEYKNIGKFNPYDDKTFAVVYNIVQFDDKEDNKLELFKTDTERRLEKLRNSRIKGTYNMNDIKIKDAFTNVQNDPEPNDGPKMKPNTNKSKQEIEKEVEVQNDDIENASDNQDKQETETQEVNYTDNSSSGPKLKQTNTSDDIEVNKEDNNLTSYYQRKNLLNKLTQDGGVRKIQLSDKDLNKRRF